MISFSLFWFAIPLAILAAIALRLTVGVLRGLQPVPSPAGHTPRLPRLDAEPMLPISTSGNDITAAVPASVGRSEAIKTTPASSVSESTESDMDDVSNGPMTVPTFKTAWALFATVFILTACLTGFARLVVLALLAILQSKGMVNANEAGAVYTVVEALLLPAGFLLLARMLQGLLPTSFVNACLIVAITIGVFFLVVTFLGGFIWGFINTVNWCFARFRV